MNTIYYLLALLFAFLCVFLVLLILIQKGRGGGLSGAFGGAGGNTAFGTKTGDLLTWVTASVFVLFILLAMGLTWTSDSINARAMATIPVNVAADDTSGTSEADKPPLEKKNPLDANGDGKVEFAPPGSTESSLPLAPDSPEPAIRPDADGSVGDAPPATPTPVAPANPAAPDPQ